MDAQSRKELLEQQRQIFITDPRTRIGLASGAGQWAVRHLAFARDAHMAWCGAKVTTAKNKRGFIVPPAWPPLLCVECIRMFEEVTGIVKKEERGK